MIFCDTIKYTHLLPISLFLGELDPAIHRGSIYGAANPFVLSTLVLLS